MPDAIPARRTGTEPVSECDAGVPANPTPIPMNTYARPIFQYGMPSLPQEQHRGEGEQQRRVAAQEREPGAARLDELGRARRDEHHEDDRGQERRARFERRVAEHVLQELLADERGAHQRAEHDDPRARRDPEDPAPGDVQVVQRVPRAALTDVEADQRGRGDRRQPDRQRPLVRDRGEVDREDQRRDQHDREDAAGVVDRLRSSR